jgi:hypothetical protein
VFDANEKLENDMKVQRGHSRITGKGKNGDTKNPEHTDYDKRLRNSKCNRPTLVKFTIFSKKM